MGQAKFTRSVPPRENILENKKNQTKQNKNNTKETKLEETQYLNIYTQNFTQYLNTNPCLVKGQKKYFSHTPNTSETMDS